MPGVKKTFLFVSVDIPEPDNLKNIELRFPDCQEWAGTNLHHWRGTEINPQPLRELVHQHIFGEMNGAYRDLFEGIKQVWKQLRHVTKQQIPAFLPNKIVHSPYGSRTIVAPNGKKWYSRRYLQKQNRPKRAIPIGAIIAGVQAVGGLLMKGADVYNKYKRNKAMAAMMDTLIENDRRFHQRMLILEGDLGVVTQMVAMGFEQINSGFQTLNRTIVRTAAEMDLMLNLTERQFKKTHEVLNNHHLALYYLSKGITTLIPLMRKYRQAVTNYRLMIKGFLDGLDELSTGRVCYEVLDPIMLAKYLRTIATDLDKSHSQYTLAFQHTYQYYAEPLISFTNSPDYLLVQIPIFLVYKHQLPMTLFLTETVLVPYDAETYLGLR